MRYFILTALLGLFVNASTAQPHSDSTAIMAQADRWVEFARAENAEGVASIYAEDAMLIPPKAPPISGRERILALFKKQYANSETSFRFQTHELKTAGNWAYRRGSYEVTYIPTNGKKMKRKAKFIDIWHKGADGEWRIARDIWNHTPLTDKEG